MKVRILSGLHCSIYLQYTRQASIVRYAQMWRVLRLRNPIGRDRWPKPIPVKIRILPQAHGYLLESK